MTKTELKQAAQDKLLFGLRASFETLSPDEDTPEMREAMSQQMARVERIFGYEPFSNGRGV